MSKSAESAEGEAAVLAALRKFDSFVVTSHARPDGDAVGSVLGCVHLLRAMGKRAVGILRDGVPKIYRHLPGALEIMETTNLSGAYQAAVVLECEGVERSQVEGLQRLFLINIDHHATASNYGNVNWVVPTAAATAELLYHLALSANVPITREMATCLYTAVLTDTGSFCYSGTNESTFELARQLVSHGADPVGIAQSVYFSNPPSKMKLLGRALSRLQRSDGVAWMFITRQDMLDIGAKEEDCEGVVNYALGIDGVEAAAFFREVGDGKFRVSLRSKGKLNVAQIAETFGGGGHSCASGHAVDGPLENAMQAVLSKLRDASFRSH